MKFAKCIPCALIFLGLLSIIALNWYGKYSGGVGLIYELRTAGWSWHSILGVAVVVIALILWGTFGGRRSE